MNKVWWAIGWSLLIIGFCICWLIYHVFIAIILLVILFLGVKLFGLHDPIILVLYTLAFCSVSVFIFVIANDIYISFWER